MCYVVVVSFYADINVKAQANLAIYTDNLVNGFQDWGWGGTRNFSNTSPTHSGNDSISAALTAGGALSFQHSDFNVTPYASLAFWAHGGTSGGQRLQVYVQYGPGAPMDRRIRCRAR